MTDDYTRSTRTSDSETAARLERVVRLYAARNQISRTISRIPARLELFEEVCRILVDTARFRLAWIGWYDAANERLDIAARYGAGSEELSRDPVSVVADELNGPTVRAFRQRQAVISNDFPKDPGAAPWHDEIAKRELRSCAAFPIVVGRQICATLSVFSCTPGLFQEEETALLVETASDIAFALENLTREMERREADAASRTLMAQLERERARLQEAQEVASIGSWETDLTTGDVTWSAETHRIFEVDPATLLPSHGRFLQFVHPDDRERIDAALTASIAAAASGASTRHTAEHRIITPHGQTKIVEERWRIFVDNDSRPVRAMGTCHDVSARNAADIRIRRLNRTYAMLSAVNKAIVHERAPEKIFQTFCEIAVSVGGFRMAWVATADPDGRHVTAVASGGVVDGYLDSLAIDRHDSTRNTGPAARALASGTHVISNYIATDPGMAPWRDRALSHGYRACAAFPIIKNGEPFGALNLYSAEPGFFDEEEVRLLDELALDLGFALAVHDRDLERARIEGQLRRSEASLRESIAELRAVTHRLNDIKEDERARIARDLHDHLGQSLTALKMDVAEVGRRLAAGNTTTIAGRLTEMSSLIDEAVHDMRRVATALRPGTLDEFGLLPAIRLHLQEIERRGGPQCVLTARLAEVPVRKDLALVAFRILQEAITNVLRHADATRVDVGVGSDDTELLLTVRDNGKGMPAPAERREGTLGLTGMRDRARLVGGDVLISGMPGEGTVVRARLPLEPPA